MESLEQIVKPLLRWYDENARILPWRQEPSPYRVWISEIMLQQTRVEAVRPYFERFVEALPNVESLAFADEDKLHKLWEGLGYYSRVRNLKKSAQIIMERFDGSLPAAVEELRRLPGIGEYTAGAIASIAFGEKACAVDGNVLRVAARLRESREDILLPAVKKKVQEDIMRILPERTGDFNQALMELGAMICLPNGKPKCSECPLEKLCRANQNGTVMELPVKADKKQRVIEELTVFILLDRDTVALEKRPGKGLLASMWQFPNRKGYIGREEIAETLEKDCFIAERIEEAGEAKHIFTHREWHMKGYLVWGKRSGKSSFVWVTRHQLKEEFAIPAAFKAFEKKLPTYLSEE